LKKKVTKLRQVLTTHPRKKKSKGEKNWTSRVLRKQGGWEVDNAPGANAAPNAAQKQEGATGEVRVVFLG